MNLDIIILGLVLCFAVIGLLSGFWRQAVRLGALVGAYLLSGPVGKPFGPMLSNSLGVSNIVGQVVGTGLAFIIIYMILSTIGWVFIRRRRRRAEQEGMTQAVTKTVERVLGAGLGAAKALAIIYLLLCVVVLAEEPIKKRAPKLAQVLQASHLAGFARNHNVLSGLHLSKIDNMVAMTKLVSDPRLREKVGHDPKMRKFANHPKIKRALSDRALIESAQRNDLAAIISNPALNDALNDPEVRDLFNHIDFAKLAK
jgi:membrane protein required for colicin V production